MSVEELGDQYCLLGPINDALVKTEVEVMEPPEPFFKNAIQSLKDSGIKVRILSNSLKSLKLFLY